MNYTLNQLNIFLKITELKSITKAAEALYLTQPAVSIQLKNFQDQFEIPLTEVIGRQLYVTPFGQEIAEATKRILAEVETMKHKSLAFKGKLTGRLTIAVVSTGKYVMPFFISEFLKIQGGVDLVMDVTNRYQVLESLEKNEVDFAFVSVLPDNLKVEKISIMENKLFLVANPELAKTFSNKTEDIFDDLPWIYREEGSATRQAMERFIANKNIQVNKKIQLTSNEAVKQAVLAGLGFSIMPLIGLKNELNDNEISIVPVNGLPIKTAWNLIWLKGKKFSPAALAYLGYLNENIESVIKAHYSWLEKY
ncbi:LysR substrate-binding domain-containing protein [Aequorivita antarctica]|uniref:LysR family transcriptional regulator n=1 Tax=Aequorivita antarctica TaxID=153266 RepID=A0A5C6Z4J1_9FLAO|nr:LysR substrate-binding domain-containing protein [Aequorivita antarctica]TXD74374.1 LysR family transcriptional regulator [Aequorivita antarctica]SRX73727.1 HTH-type transcriptional activator CmpR [Aequorivita antarctica]